MPSALSGDIRYPDYSRNLLRRFIFSEIKYRRSENIVKRLDLVHQRCTVQLSIWMSYTNRDRENGKLMRQITFTVELGYKHSPGLKNSMLTTRLFL